MSLLSQKELNDFYKKVIINSQGELRHKHRLKMASNTPLWIEALSIPRDPSAQLELMQVLKQILSILEEVDNEEDVRHKLMSKVRVINTEMRIHKIDFLRQVPNRQAFEIKKALIQNIMDALFPHVLLTEIEDPASSQEYYKYRAQLYLFDHNA